MILLRLLSVENCFIVFVVTYYDKLGSHVVMLAWLTSLTNHGIFHE